MIRSDYFKIVDRNYFDETGRIAEWSEEHPEYSHKITADVQLTNVIFRYKYLYL